MRSLKKKVKRSFNKLNIVLKIFPESFKTLLSIWMKKNGVCYTIRKIFNLLPKMWLKKQMVAGFVFASYIHCESNLNKCMLYLKSVICHFLIQLTARKQRSIFPQKSNYSFKINCGLWPLKNIYCWLHHNWTSLSLDQCIPNIQLKQLKSRLED